MPEFIILCMKFSLISIHWEMISHLTFLLRKDEILKSLDQISYNNLFYIEIKMILIINMQLKPYKNIDGIILYGF